MRGAALGVLCGQTAFAATTAWYAQRSYRIPYEVGRLSKVVIVSIGLVGGSTFVHMASPGVDLLLSGVLLACYPLLLWAVGFLAPIEKSAVRKIAGDTLMRWSLMRGVRP